MARGGARPGSGRRRGHNAIASEKAREYIIKRVSDELEPIMDKAIEQAKSGDGMARRELMDRAYGRPTESIKIEGDLTIKIDV